jgi:tol-pal system protein YbgF
LGKEWQMKHGALWMIVVVALLGAGCVSEEQLRLQREVLELTRRVDGMERSLRSVQEETAGGIKERMGTITRQQAELQAGIDSVRVDMQGAQGRFDDLGRADTRLRQDLTLLRDELGLQVADVGKRLTKLEEAAAKPATPVEESADALYERGLQTIRDQQEPAAGREVMSTFLKRYPADPRAVNAAYWIGETFYTEKAYDKAVLQFEEVVQKYGDDPKVAAALYKQALAFDAIKDRASARLVLKKLLERFPLAEEAKKGKEKLKEWK